uniref:Transposase Tc1-like domain-containing protein n=1 Tax=Lates calcarifer TaxID=8187 RepID=A0A4W6DBT0_LATCA
VYIKPAHLKETGLKIQILIQEGYRKGIARKYRCSPSAVGFTLQKYRRTNSLEDKPRSGRLRVSSARNDRILQGKPPNDITGASAAVIKPNWCPVFHLRCTWLTFRSYTYKAVKKTLINERQRLAQRLWAQAHKNWTARNWKKILWSDESRSLCHSCTLLCIQ